MHAEAIRTEWRICVAAFCEGRLPWPAYRAAAAQLVAASVARACGDLAEAKTRLRHAAAIQMARQPV